MLILCAATFAVGILAGSLFFGESESFHARAAPETRSSRRIAETDRDGWTEPDATGERSHRKSAAGRSRNVDVRTLTAEAAAEIERIKSGERAEAFLAGDGTISGTVRDPSGEPVPGIVVTAVPEAQPAGLSVARRRARQQPHRDRELSDVSQEAIQVELWRRYARRTATSGANGRFEIEGVTDSNHTVTAFHEDFEVKPLSQGAKVRPGAVVDFLARPVVEVRIEVRMPDDSLAEYAWLRWTGPHGNGRDAWNPQLDRVRLPSGRCKVKATTWLPEPMESAEVERVIGAEGSDEALVLKLESRQMLTARLDLPEGFLQPRRVEYRIRLLIDAEEVDPESLRQDRSGRPASASGGRAYWIDLDPGRYLVAAFLDGRRLIAHATAEVGEGASEVALEMSTPTGNQLTVKLRGPGGGPIPGQASFRVITGPEDRPRTERVDALQSGDGSWLVFLDKVKAEKGSDALLRVGTRDYGGATRPMSLNGGTITIRFGKPARLKVKLEGYGGSGVEGALYVALRGKVGADAWRRVTADGSVDLNGVQPGDYNLNLYVRKNNRNWSIYQRRIDLRAGEDEIMFAIPALHTLKVRWAGKGRPRNVVLRSSDEGIGKLRRDARLAGRVATFQFLAAGTYEVECARKKATARVPGAEVVLQ